MNIKLQNVPERQFIAEFKLAKSMGISILKFEKLLKIIEIWPSTQGYLKFRNGYILAMGNWMAMKIMVVTPNHLKLILGMVAPESREAFFQ